MTASAERIRQNTQKWDGQENRQNHTGNFIKVVKQEVEKEREEESAVLISENNEVKQEEVDFEQQKHREDESELSTSESEDDVNISQFSKSKGKQIDCSSVVSLCLLCIMAFLFMV